MELLTNLSMQLLNQSMQMLNVLPILLMACCGIWVLIIMIQSGIIFGYGLQRGKCASVQIITYVLGFLLGALFPPCWLVGFFGVGWHID